MSCHRTTTGARLSAPWSGYFGRFAFAQRALAALLAAALRCFLVRDLFTAVAPMPAISLRRSLLSFLALSFASSEAAPFDTACVYSALHACASPYKIIVMRACGSA